MLLRWTKAYVYASTMPRSTNRVHRTHDEWAALVRAWDASGLSATAFARDKDFSSSSLYAWRKRLATETGTDVPPEVSFVPVVVEETTASGDGLGWRIQTGAGVVVSMNGPGARDGLEVALRALGEQGALL